MTILRCSFADRTIRKRHIVTDTLGLLVVVLVWADGSYAGKLLTVAWHHFRILVEIIKRSDDATGFEALHRRWVIEPTNPWLMRTRRLARDYERLPEHAKAIVQWAVVGDMTRRLAPGPGRRPWQPARPLDATS